MASESERVLKTNLKYSVKVVKNSTCLSYEQKSLINIPTKTFFMRTLEVGYAEQTIFAFCVTIHQIKNVFVKTKHTFNYF